MKRLLIAMLVACAALSVSNAWMAVLVLHSAGGQYGIVIADDDGAVVSHDRYRTRDACARAATKLNDSTSGIVASCARIF